MECQVGGGWKLFMSLVTCHLFRRVFGFPGEEKNQPHAGANGGVGDVEGGKINDAAAALLQVKIKKIHNRVAAGQQAVGEVAGDAAENQAEGNLAGERVRTEVMAREKQRDKREQADQGECGVVAAEETPRRAGVAPVDQFEKTINDDLFVAQKRKGVQHQPFGELVERKHHQRERGDAAI